MELKRVIGNTRMPDVTFYEDGHIDISATAARVLGLMPGDVIDMAVDGIELYLMVSSHGEVGRHMARCYPSSHRGGHYRLNSKRLVNYIRRYVGRKDKAIRAYAGEVLNKNGQKLLSIIPR